VSLLGIVAVAAALAASPAAGGAGAERLPATCIAEMGTAGVAHVYVGTPEYPKLVWNANEFFVPYATATGEATFTPSGQVNVNCVFDGWAYPAPFGPAVWPLGTFTSSAPCATARGGDDNGHGAAVYEGVATVTTVKKTPAVSGPAQVKISCHMKYTHSWQ
jgi:hypothetical protein